VTQAKILAFSFICRQQPGNATGMAPMPGAFIFSISASQTGCCVVQSLR
jgi:hypothetical protein